MKWLRCERMKVKGRFIFLTMLIITGVELCWLLYGHYSDDQIQKGWMMFLFQLPLVQAIFLSLLSTVLASRLADIDHKGGMLKQLFCSMPRGALYDAKLCYGLFLLFLSILFQYAGIYIGGKVLGFGGSFPVKLYLLQLLFTTATAFSIYIFQHTLSMLYKNQAIPFFTGIIGEFFGLFSMFLPRLPWLRKSLLWGYFGVLQFVGNDWDKATRINTFYLLDIDWPFFVVLLAAGILLYFTGKKLFSQKEV